ncbi:transporter substrate-binding domain-containing protein [uncultured Mobiluncus sp.]|uniref:transporter substrate-binding domain-containing protein n=1 Tax=uncultured Mobiluncus sp. TaxID=293425 RepID=UPI00262CE2CF|nr:transporter substrate-binding domain-containing protein [uncultured Mobiluncus sp.]
MVFKKIVSLAAGLAVAFSLTACGGDSSHNAGTEGGNTAKSAGDKFVVGFDANFPPYGYKDETTGEYTGFDLDLAAEVAKRNDWTLEKKPIDWDAKDMQLDSGLVDCLWNGFTMNGREDKYTWSKPYVDNSIVFVTRSADNLKEAAALEGKTVIVQADSSGLAALEDEANKDLLASFKALNKVPDYNNAFMSLEAGAADAVAVDIGVANYQLETRKKGLFTIMEKPVQTEQYGVGFKLGNEALRDQVQNTLDEMITDGKFRELAQKYGLENAVITK